MAKPPNFGVSSCRVREEETCPTGSRFRKGETCIG